MGADGMEYWKIRRGGDRRSKGQIVPLIKTANGGFDQYIKGTIGPFENRIEGGGNYDQKEAGASPGGTQASGDTGNGQSRDGSRYPGRNKGLVAGCGCCSRSGVGSSQMGVGHDQQPSR